MQHTLRCRCGTVQGRLDSAGCAGRALCYCRDCQAFARWLDRAADVLDAAGGTEVVAAAPHRLQFTAGQDRVACMSLGPQGLLRWYAGCCNTAIGNTPRDRRMSYVGIVRSCLPGSDDDIAAAFGPLRIRVNTAGATQPVQTRPAATVLGVLRIMRSVLGARLSGAWKRNPFFDSAGQPMVAPTVLTQAQRQALRTPG